MDAFNVLKERGFLYQLTDEENIPKKLADQKVNFYLGIDPTADSLHIGHLLPIMAARWLQKCGHRPIFLIGGGTAMIGDPSGKTEMRQLLSVEDISFNAETLGKQITRFAKVAEEVSEHGKSKNTGFILNNLDWLQDLKYLEFLRDFGKNFSVNRMLTAESIKLRLATGLSFLEFNYMLLQAFDFFYLCKKYECTLQIGGQDQWANIIAGVDLIRRMSNKLVYGITLPLLTDKHGRKFGKTVKGAIWLDEKKTSIYDYYQFWRNIDDTEVANLLALYTSLPMDEVHELGKLKAPEINRAKEILAFEATSLAHGKEAAKKIFLAVAEQFGYADPNNTISTTSSIIEVHAKSNQRSLPSIRLSASELESGIWIVRLMVKVGLATSNGDARRLIQNGGVYLNQIRLTDVNKEVKASDFQDDQLLLRSGKKNIRRVIVDN